MSSDPVLVGSGSDGDAALADEASPTNTTPSAAIAAIAMNTARVRVRRPAAFFRDMVTAFLLEPG
ncbi:hypothetical protein GCM10023066_12120 [Nocardioides kongjuensis]